MLGMADKVDFKAGIPETCRVDWLAVEEIEDPRTISLRRVRTLIVTGDEYEGIGLDRDDPYMFAPYYLVETNARFIGNERNLKPRTQGIGRATLFAANRRGTEERVHRAQIEIFDGSDSLGIGVGAEKGYEPLDGETDKAAKLRGIVLVTMVAIEKYVNGASK